MSGMRSQMLAASCSTIVKRIEPTAGTAVLIITGELFL